MHTMFADAPFGDFSFNRRPVVAKPPNKPRNKLNAVERECMDKIPLTEDEAIKEARRLSRLRKLNIKSYRCDHCGEFHVGKVRHR